MTRFISSRTHPARGRLLVGLLASAMLVGALVGTGVAARLSGGTPSALDRAPTLSDRLPAGAGGIGALKAGESRRVAAFRSTAGALRAVYVTRTSDGRSICLWDTDLSTGAQGGGCNDAEDFFGGRQLSISLGYDGGPSISAASNARIVGVVTPVVDRVEIVATNGTHTPVPITVDRAFAYVVPQAELQRGVGPKEVVAYAADGAVIDRETTGVGR